MSWITLLVILAALALAWWLVNIKYPTQLGPMKWLMNIVIVGTAIGLVLYAFGIWPRVKDVQVPHVM